MSKIDEIYEFVLPEMESLKIEDTTENRISFLMGLSDAWKEDTDRCLEKTLYQLALTSEINCLRLKLMFPRIMG